MPKPEIELDEKKNCVHQEMCMFKDEPEECENIKICKFFREGYEEEEKKDVFSPRHRRPSNKMGNYDHFTIDKIDIKKARQILKQRRQRHLLTEGQAVALDVYAGKHYNGLTEGMKEQILMILEESTGNVLVKGKLMTATEAKKVVDEGIQV